MPRITLVFLLLTLVATALSAEPPETFQQAKALSAESGKPILMEFVHED